MFPLWQRGMEGDFKNICLFIIYKISPNPSLPKRGIMRLYQKTIYKQTLVTAFTALTLNRFKCYYSLEIKDFYHMVTWI